MVKILHLSDLHFIKNAAAYNTKEILLREAKEKVKNVPQGQKLLIITGDLHNFWEADYAPAEEFIHELVRMMDIDMKQDVFIVPGNHDVGNDSALQSLLSKGDPDWKKHHQSSITMLRNGDMSYIPERLRAFRPYSVLAQHLGIYDPALGDDYPAQTHLRNWRGKLNILHLNTALIADGISKRDQMTDTDAAANPDTWKSFDTKHIPAIAIAHNSFYDMERKQREELAASFLLYNVSAYLFGERHQIEPEYQMIRLTAGYKKGEEIPNLVATRRTTNTYDDYAEAGFCWHEWDEKTDRVIVNFMILDHYVWKALNSENIDMVYEMRRNRELMPVPSPLSSIIPDPELKKYLDDLLRRIRDNHPSFLSLKPDIIDQRLFPSVKAPEQYKAYGKTVENGSVSPVWNIIQASWKSSEKSNIIIEGVAGIGKTVTLFSILNLKDDDLPPAVYVPVRSLVTLEGQRVNLTDYFRKLSSTHGNRINRLAEIPWDKRPQLLVLLDGFNEIPFAQQRGILHMLNEWNAWHPGAQLIAASRPLHRIDLGKELEGTPITITLEPMSLDAVRNYLGEWTLPEASPLWHVLTLPLFLKLYQKSANLEGFKSNEYALAPKQPIGDGTLIWNLLQRELLRENSEAWVIRCAFACEYILPSIAYRMEQENSNFIEMDIAVRWIKKEQAAINMEKLPRHLSKLINTYKVRHSAFPDLSAIDWNHTVLNDVGLMIREADGYSYSFVHKNVQEALAGLYLVNQAEMMREGDYLPEVWRREANYIQTDYAAELMEQEDAERLWETNRKNHPTDRSSTYAMLELMKRRKDGNNTTLNFSGMDLRELNLTRYLLDGRQGEKDMKLFRKAVLSEGTRFSENTFCRLGHEGPVNCVAVTKNGLCISGSDDSTLQSWDSASGSSLSIFSEGGHSGWITCMVTLPDGWIVSGSRDNTLRLWDAETGECLNVMMGHTDQITCMAALPNGNVVSGSYDSTLRVWAPNTGNCLRVLSNHKYGIQCVAAMPDGRIISGSSDNTLQVWGVDTNRCLHTLRGHTDWVRCVAVRPDGLVISGAYDGTLRVWDAAIGRCLRILKGHTGFIKCLAILPNGRVVSGSSDHTLRVWDADTGECLQTLKGHTDCVTCLAVLPDGLFISGSADHTLRLWNADSGRCMHILEGHSGWITCLAVLPGGLVASGSMDKTLRVWNLYSGKCRWVLERYRNAFNVIARLPRRCFISGSDDCALRVWDWNGDKGQCQRILTGHTNKIRCLTQFKAWGVVSGSDDRTLRVWNAQTGQCLHTLMGHSGRITCMAIIRREDIYHVVSGSDDCTLRIWDTKTGMCLKILKGHTGWVNCVDVLPYGRVVSGSSDKTLRVWDIDTGECLCVLKGHEKRITCLAVLLDNIVVSGSEDRSLRIWNADKRECLHILKEHTGWITCVAVFEDGRLVSGSDDGTIWLWDTGTGKSLRPLKGHTDRINFVTVLTNRRVLSGSDDHTLRVWDANTGQCLQTLKGHSGPVACASMHMEEEFVSVISGSDDNTLRVWDPDVGESLLVFESTEADVSKMDLSRALLPEKTATLLRQNGAKISKMETPVFENGVKTPNDRS